MGGTSCHCAMAELQAINEEQEAKAGAGDSCRNISETHCTYLANLSMSPKTV